MLPKQWDGVQLDRCVREWSKPFERSQGQDIAVDTNMTSHHTLYSTDLPSHPTSRFTRPPSQGHPSYLVSPSDPVITALCPCRCWWLCLRACRGRSVWLTWRHWSSSVTSWEHRPQQQRPSDRRTPNRPWWQPCRIRYVCCEKCYEEQFIFYVKTCQPVLTIGRVRFGRVKMTVDE